MDTSQYQACWPSTAYSDGRTRFGDAELPRESRGRIRKLTLADWRGERVRSAGEGFTTMAVDPGACRGFRPGTAAPRRPAVPSGTRLHGGLEVRTVRPRPRQGWFQRLLGAPARSPLGRRGVHGRTQRQGRRRDDSGPGRQRSAHPAARPGTATARGGQAVVDEAQGCNCTQAAQGWSPGRRRARPGVIAGAGHAERAAAAAISTLQRICHQAAGGSVRSAPGSSSFGPARPAGHQPARSLSRSLSPFRHSARRPAAPPAACPKYLLHSLVQSEVVQVQHGDPPPPQQRAGRRLVAGHLDDPVVEVAVLGGVVGGAPTVPAEHAPVARPASRSPSPTRCCLCRRCRSRRGRAQVRFGEP